MYLITHSIGFIYNFINRVIEITLDMITLLYNLNNFEMNLFSPCINILKQEVMNKYGGQHSSTVRLHNVLRHWCIINEVKQMETMYSCTLLIFYLFPLFECCSGFEALHLLERINAVTNCLLAQYLLYRYFLPNHNVTRTSTL